MNYQTQSILLLFCVTLQGMESSLHKTIGYKELEHELQEALSLQELTWPLRRKINLYTAELKKLAQKLGPIGTANEYDYIYYIQKPENELKQITKNITACIKQCEKIHTYTLSTACAQECLREARRHLWCAASQLDEYQIVHDTVIQRLG